MIEREGFQFDLEAQRFIENRWETETGERVLQEIIDGIIDFPLAMHQFNKLCSGNKNVGSDISLLFNPHRLEVKVNSRKYSVFSKRTYITNSVLVRTFTCTKVTSILVSRTCCCNVSVARV